MLSRRHGPFYSEAEKPKCRVVTVGAGPAGLLAAIKRAPYRGARDPPSHGRGSSSFASDATLYGK
eukprot:scaffold13735_cov105-Phaeocystis_antarctica.AAC.1